MSVQEIEAAVAELSPDELAHFAQWFEQYRADAWDQQIESDVAAGRLDALARQADDDFEGGNGNASACLELA